MKVVVTTRDGANHLFDGVNGIVVQEPGQPTPPPVRGQLVISATAMIAWMVLADETPNGTSREIDIVEGSRC